MTDNQYSVYQFFEDGSYEKVREFVSAAEASTAAGHYCSSVAVQMGLVSRVIITDGGDCICFEWLRDKGIVFPPQKEVKVH